MELTAFVLAGGKSSRMGADKAFLSLDGQTLLERALNLARTIAPTVHILGSKAKFAAYANTVEDIFPECGPLGGIHAALTVTTTDLNLILAVDLPFLRSEFLRYLLGEAERSKALVTLSRVTSTEAPAQSADMAPPAPDQPGAAQSARRRRSDFQPLCAIYHRAFRECAEAALRLGHNKIAPLLAPAETRIITQAELAHLSFPITMFDNLNTPEELERAARHRGASKP